MRELPNQGDIIRLEDIKVPVLVVSKDFFNMSGEVIGCPIYDTKQTGALHISIQTDKISGVVQSEKLSLLDLNTRGYTIMGNIKMRDIIEVTYAIQSIFDYI